MAKSIAGDPAAHSVFFADHCIGDSHDERSLRSGAISVVARCINILTQVGSTIILARLLSPEDFGLVAMVLAITGLAGVMMDLGTRDATAQKSRITPEEVSALFWLTCGIGVGLAALTILCSPLIARFYQDSQAAQVAQVAALTFVFGAVSSQHTALLRRALMFNKLAMIEIGANLFGVGAAIVMALAGGGFWALIFRQILAAFFTAVAVWLCCRWIPGIPKFSKEVKESLKFGLHVTGFTITDYLAKAGDRVVLGLTTGARELGYYQNASLIYDNVSAAFLNPLHAVAVSSLSKLRDNVERLRHSWSMALSSLTFFLMPAFVTLAVIGPDVVIILFGEKWSQAGWILTLIALRGPAHVVERTMGWLHMAAGRADRWMRWGLLSSLVQVIALLCGAPFGVMGIAAACTGAFYLLCVPAIIYAGSPLGIGLSHLARAAGPQFLGVLLTMAVGFLLRMYLADVSGGERIAGLVLACTLTYLIVTVGFFRLVKPFAVAHSLVLHFVPVRWSVFSKRLG